MYRNALVVLKAAKPRSIPPRIAEVAAVITTVTTVSGVAVVVSDIVETVTTAAGVAVVVSNDIVTIEGQARDDASGRIIAGRRRRRR